MTLYRWLGQGPSWSFPAGHGFFAGEGLVARRGHGRSFLLGGCRWTTLRSMLSREPRRATTRLTLRVHRTAGGVRGPRRRWGFETRSETQFSSTRCSRRLVMGSPGASTLRTRSSLSIGALLDTRFSGAPHGGAGTTDYAVLALRTAGPALAGGRAALASAVGAERRSFFAASSSARARRAVRLACCRTPRAASWASRALS